MIKKRLKFKSFNFGSIEVIQERSKRGGWRITKSGKVSFFLTGYDRKLSILNKTFLADRLISGQIGHLPIVGDCEFVNMRVSY